MELEHLRKIWRSFALMATAYRHYVTPPGAFLFEPELQWFLIDQPVLPVLLVAHALFASLNIYRLTRGRQFWLKSLVLTIFAAFGGSTLASICTAKPVPLLTHSSNFMLSYVTVAWYAVNHYSTIRNFLSFRPIAAVLAFTAMAAKARTIFNFIDQHNRLFPGAAAGAIVLGGLCGSGGSFFITLERIVQHGFSAAGDLSAPGWGFKSAYIAAAAYYVATDPHMMFRTSLAPVSYALHPRAARFWIALFLCSHAAVETLVGTHINPFFVFEHILFAVTGVRKHSEADAPPEPHEPHEPSRSPEQRPDRGAEMRRRWVADEEKQRNSVRRRTRPRSEL
eukprot:gb/GEZJ01000689.1/.p1 GENE.gb/GEZJ01000689.1/~~gb/GEZJ01000689.1/.p1  ORF type:complete len:348 (+),score=46.71 gb/GEZJ01000689.1/:35-1045(+)